MHLRILIDFEAWRKQVGVDEALCRMERVFMDLVSPAERGDFGAALVAFND